MSKLAFLVEAIVDDLELVRINEGRIKLGQQLHTPDDWLHNILSDALNRVGVTEGSVVQAVKGSQ